MSTLTGDETLVSFCGLYCGSCKSYLNRKCAGCQKNEKASWCKVRSCCKSNNYDSCANCTQYTNQMQCKKFNNFISKIFSFIFKSDRIAAIQLIRSAGKGSYAKRMAGENAVCLKKK